MNIFGEITSDEEIQKAASCLLRELRSYGSGWLTAHGGPKLGQRMNDMSAALARARREAAETRRIQAADRAAYLKDRR